VELADLVGQQFGWQEEGITRRGRKRLSVRRRARRKVSATRSAKETGKEEGERLRFVLALCR
jgi:hypothetical protein